ncbi:MAG: response regulator, partial [Actinomycetota bacterium]|nr:response regulator [Actinomycetota bacterium]
MTQHRLLLAIADAALAQSAVALMQEGEGLQIVDRVGDAEEAARALRRLEIDVVVLHDALGTVPVMEVARDIASSFPEVGLVLLAADDSPDVLRAAMQAGVRDVVTLPLSLEQLEG